MSLRFCQMPWLSQLTYYPSVDAPPSDLNTSFRRDSIAHYQHCPHFQLCIRTSIPVLFSSRQSHLLLLLLSPSSSLSANSSHLVCRAYSILSTPACFVPNDSSKLDLSSVSSIIFSPRLSFSAIFNYLSLLFFFGVFPFVPVYEPSSTTDRSNAEHLFMHAWYITYIPWRCSACFRLLYLDSGLDANCIVRIVCFALLRLRLPCLLVVSN